MARELHNQGLGLDDFVAALTEAAYPIALRHKGGEEWLDLELELWRVLTQTVQRWERRALGGYACHPATLSNVVGLGHGRDARQSLAGE